MGFVARPPAPLHNRQSGQTKLSFTAYFLEKGEILAFSHYVGDFLIGFDKVSVHSLNKAVLNSLLNFCKCSMNWTKNCIIITGTEWMNVKKFGGASSNVVDMYNLPHWLE